MSERGPRKPLDYTRYKLRVCYSMHKCALCSTTIMLSQEYHDGGHGRRAHKGCAEAQKERDRDLLAHIADPEGE